MTGTKIAGTTAGWTRVKRSMNCDSNIGGDDRSSSVRACTLGAAVEVFAVFGSPNMEPMQTIQSPVPGAREFSGGGRERCSAAGDAGRLAPVSARDEAARFQDDEEEVVDAVVVAEGREVAPARAPMPVVAQAAAVAATGFAAGAVTAAVVRRARARRTVKAARRRQPALPVLGTRSFLVDVHLLGSRD
jgi:hypothetical protein